MNPLRPSWSQQLPLIFGAIVLSFAAATVFTHSRLLAIDRSSLEIAENASPSIERLAAARSEMRQLQVRLRDYLDRRAAGEPASTKALEESRQSMNQSIRDYLNLPVFPNEQQLWGAILRGKDAVNDAVAHALSEAERPDFPAEEATVVDEIAVASDALGAAITRGVELNAGQSHDLAMQIERRRRQSTYTAFGLDAACALVTLLGAFVLRRAMRSHLELAERHQRLLAERASELEQFAGTVAHDILSPLNAVGLALQLAGQPGDDERRARTIAHGASAIKRVSRLVHGLLDFAVSGARPDPTARTEVGRTLAELGAALQPAAVEANVELRVEANVTCEVSCNEGVLTSLVSNLAYNALKYIGDGPNRRIDVRALDQGACVRVEIRDTGPGLPPGLEQRVFEPYVRGGRSTKGGIGLGLATVKRLAEAHGGRVGVHSVPGEGCTFWFELPKAEARDRVPLAVAHAGVA